MDTKMSQKTRSEVLAKQRARYARAGKEHKTKIINELVELFDYHRKAAIRALQPRRVLGVPFVIGRPKEYDPDKLRALPNRSEAATLLQIRDVEEHLPFPLCGLDSDNGGASSSTIIWSNNYTSGRSPWPSHGRARIARTTNHFLPTIKLESLQIPPPDGHPCCSASSSPCRACIGLKSELRNGNARRAKL